MTPEMLLKTLNQKGIEVWPEGQNLRVKGRLTGELRKRVKDAKRGLLALLNGLPGDFDSNLHGRFIHGISVNQLRYKAGADWAQLSRDPRALECFAALVSTSNLISAGEVPEAYTSKTHCKNCGAVPIFEGAPREAECCPWCFAGWNSSAERCSGDFDRQA